MSIENMNLKTPENSLAVLYESEWEINTLSTMSEPASTPVFSPLKEVDARLNFDIFYQASRPSGGTDDVAYLQVNLRKTKGAPIPKTLTFDLGVLVLLPNGGLYAQYSSPYLLNLSCLSSMSCIKSSTPFYLEEQTGLQIQTSYFTLKCQMIFYNYLPTTSTYHGEIRSRCHLVNFANNYKTIYQSKEFSDVSVRVCDKTIKCHKFVLSAHSPVLKSMIENENLITISDIGYEVFEELLHYLYCAEVKDLSLHNVKQLLFIAKKYEVEPLKQECLRILTR